MDRLWQDIRVSLRGLWKDRSFTLTTVATLALCLAANVAIFAVVDGVLLKPLPFDEPDRIVTISNAYPGAGVAVADNGVPDYYDRLQGVAALESLSSYRSSGFTVGGDNGQAERIQGLLATPSFFHVLRVQPHIGRLFTEEEAEPGQDQKLILSYGYWQTAFGGQASAVGQTLRVNGVSMPIVGVLPQGFRFVDPEIQMVRAVAFSAEDRGDDRRHSNNWHRARPAQGRRLGRAGAEPVERHQRREHASDSRSWREILTNAALLDQRGAVPGLSWSATSGAP